MKSKNRAVKSFKFTKISCNSHLENVIIQLRVVGHYKKCLYGLYSFADAARTPHGDGNTANHGIIIPPSRMQPAPLTGTATVRSDNAVRSGEDAARTPHGDGN